MAKLNVAPNYKPHTKQMLLHNAPIGFNDITIILYGGARGGGKSAGILMDAVFFCTTYPGAKAIIFRENLSSLKQSFVDKLPTLFPATVIDAQGKKHTLYEYKDSSGRYPMRSIIFPNGSYITFQRVSDYKEAKSFQGWECHYLAIDEVTKQEERSVNYLLSIVRSVTLTNPYTGKPLRIPTKVVFGCNPGGIGHQWVKRKFIDTTVIRKHSITNAPIQTKDAVYFLDDPDGGDPIKTTIRFIPASWKDNPFLSKAYRATLMSQDKHTRQMDMDGNWDVVAGRMFEFTDDSFLSPSYIRQYATANAKHLKDIYISIDWGYKPSFHSAIWHYVFEDTSVISYAEMYGQEMIFEEFVQTIADKSAGLYITATLLPHDLYRRGDTYRDDSGRIIGEMKSDVFDYYDLNPVGVESGKGKVQMRYDKIHSASKITMEQDGKIIKRFRISTACSKGLKNELDNAVYDDITLDHIAKKCKDHAIDSYGLFLVFYSSDIAPISIMDVEVKEYEPRLVRLLREEDEKLFEPQKNIRNKVIANYYDM